MNEIERINELLDNANVDNALRDMVKAWVGRAYNAGFTEGMKRATEVNSKSFNLLFESMRGAK